MPNAEKKHHSSEEKHITEKLLASYQVLASRRLGYDTLMWQTPILGLTAQAFLFSSALSPSSSQTARLIAMSLALVTSLLSMQLMSKHRHHEMTDSQTLERIEREHKLSLLHSSSSARDSSLKLPRSWFVNLSSYRVWMAGLALFAIAAASIIVITIVKPELLNGVPPVSEISHSTPSPASSERTAPPAAP